MKITVTVNADKRYYLDGEKVENGSRIVRSIQQFNDMKIVLYNKKYDASVLKKEDVYGKGGTYASFLKEYAASMGYTTHLSNYYTCSINSSAGGVLRSQRDLIPVYKENKEAAISSCKSKVKGDRETLRKKEKVKASLKGYARTGKWKAPYTGCPLKVKDGVMTYGQKKVDPSEYERGIEQEIRDLKTRIRLVEDRQRRFEKELADLKEKPLKRVAFGTKKRYARKDSAGDMDTWREEFRESRNRSMCLAGRHTSKDGNYLAKLVKGSLYVTNIDGSITVFREFALTRYQDEFRKNLGIEDNADGENTGEG